MEIHSNMNLFAQQIQNVQNKLNIKQPNPNKINDSSLIANYTRNMTKIEMKNN